MIAAIHVQTSEAVARMDNATRQVETGIGMIRNVQQPLDVLRKSSAKAVGSLVDLSNAAREQTHASTQISQNVERIAEAGEKNSDAAASSHVKAQELNRMADSLTEAVKRFRRGNAEEARALAAKGIAHFKAVGAERAFADFSAERNDEWIYKDLYISVIRSDGTMMAHGFNRAMIGKNVIDAKDPAGKYYTREHIATGMKGAGWVDYQFIDPLSKRLVAKSSYAARLEGYDGVIAVGIYKS
jgi:ABC-type transporter Mla subunit MlaD